MAPRPGGINCGHIAQDEGWTMGGNLSMDWRIVSEFVGRAKKGNGP